MHQDDLATLFLPRDFLGLERAVKGLFGEFSAPMGRLVDHSIPRVQRVLLLRVDLDEGIASHIVGMLIPEALLQSIALAQVWLRRVSVKVSHYGLVGIHYCVLGSHSVLTIDIKKVREARIVKRHIRSLLSAADTIENCDVLNEVLLVSDRLPSTGCQRHIN